MKETEFLRTRNVIPKDGTDLIIGFDNGTNESLIELLKEYHESELKKLRVGDVSEMLKSFVTYAKSRSISDININDDTIDYFIEDFNLH